MRTDRAEPTLAAADLPTVSGHLDALDGMRALASFAVLTFHVAIESGAALQDGFFSSLLARGDVAVPVFFVLSGLLLYRPYAAAALHGGKPPAIRTYLLKRALRILPAYWIVVVTAMLLWSEDHLTNLRGWLELLLLGQNYDVHPWWFGLGPQGLAQMWSLSVEMAFYLVLPLVAAALAAYAGRGGADLDTRAKRLLIGLAVLAASSYLWTVLSFYPSYVPNMNTWLPRSWTYFGAGMALSVVSLWARSHPGGPAHRFGRVVTSSTGTLWLIAALAYAIAATPLTGPRFAGIDGVWAGLSELALYTLIAACLVAPAALLPGGDNVLGRLLGNPVMRFFGRISYGVFLWQFVALFAWYDFTGQTTFTGNFPINLLAVAVITVILATLTHRYVEEPARRLARAKRAPAVPAPAGPAAVTPMGPPIVPPHPAPAPQRLLP